jgi:hypothetical protein
MMGIEKLKVLLQIVNVQDVDKLLELVRLLVVVKKVRNLVQVIKEKETLRVVNNHLQNVCLR